MSVFFLWYNFFVRFCKKEWNFMQLSDATRERIKELLKEKDMKLFDLSKAAGVALPTISDFLKNDTKNLRMDTMLHICEGFNITLKDFFNNSLFDEVISE